MGSYAEVDYNHTLCPLQSRIQHLYHGQTYARVNFSPQSGTMNFASAVPVPSRADSFTFQEDRLQKIVKPEDWGTCR